MNILENYNTAKQKYGEKLVKSLSDIGIPSQYLLSACRFTTEGINPNDIKQYFRQWMTYVKRNDGGRYDVNRMSFDEFYQTIQTFKSKYGISNKVYDDGTVSVGKITSPSDISRFPVKNEWCIKQPNQFRKYTNQGYTFYLIDNGDESDYVRYVVLMVGKDGRKYYYDLDNSEMTPNSISEFQSHLTPNAVSFIQNLNNRQKTNENRNMNKKQTLRLNEAQFNNLVTKIVKESVKRVLKESESDTMWQGGPPKSYYDMCDTTNYGGICNLKSLASWFNRNGTPSEGVFPKNLPPYMKEVQVTSNNFYGAYPGEMIIISSEEPDKYLYFDGDGFGAGYAKVQTGRFTDDDYKDW